MKWKLHYDSLENAPYMACQNLEPLLSFAFPPTDVWSASKTKQEFQKEALENGHASVTFTGGGNRMHILVIHEDFKV